MGKMSKEQAIKSLKEQIKSKKAEMSQEDLDEMNKIANKIMSGEKNIAAPNSALPKDSVPYDKEAAMKALRLYIENSDDPVEAEKRILELLKKDPRSLH